MDISTTWLPDAKLYTYDQLGNIVMYMVNDAV